MVIPKSKNKDSEREKAKERAKKKAINARYNQRITLAKNGQEASSKGDYINAVKYYNRYLKVLADVKEIDEKKMRPKHFDAQKDLSELLLISHIYWDLSKIYDRNDNFRKDFQHYLHQFVDFSKGQKFQVMNAEMLRKFIQRGRNMHKQDFKDAYKEIYMGGAKCYISSYCYSPTHDITVQLREFRDELNFHIIGHKLVKLYYKVSPKILIYLTTRPNTQALVLPLFKKLLKISVYILKAWKRIFP